MRKYSTIDFLPDLTSTEMLGAGVLTFSDAPPHETAVGYDYRAIDSGLESNAILHSIYSFNAFEGATYDIISISLFDPFLLRIYDQNGNTIEVNSERNDPADFNTGVVDYFSDWVAPYTGTYYVEASWNQGGTDTFYQVSIHEDLDTITSEPISAKAGRIFNWGEDEFSSLFPDHPEAEIISGFYTRLYSNGNALAEQDGDIYFYDGEIDSIFLVGSVSDFLPQAIADGF